MSCEIAPLMAKPRPSVYATASRTVRERVDPRGRRAELVSFGQRRRARTSTVRCQEIGVARFPTRCHFQWSRQLPEQTLDAHVAARRIDREKAHKGFIIVTIVASDDV